MIQRNYLVVDPAGLHARPAARFVKQFQSLPVSCTVAANGKTANPASILEILALGVRQGEEITLSISASEDEASAAFDAIENNLAGLIEPASRGNAN